MNDIRYTLRRLGRSRGFTATVAVTLALGVGVATAVVSLVHGVLWRPLPYPDADRLVRIWESQPRAGRARVGVSQLSVAHWRDHASTLESISQFSIYFQGDFLEIANLPVTVRLAQVDADFLRVLNRTAAVLEPGYLLSDSFWRAAFGGAAITGAAVRRERHADTVLPVLGIMPPAFSVPADADVWRVAAQTRPRMGLSERRSRRFEAIARLKPGVSRERAHRELQQLSADLASLYPDSHAGWSPDTEYLEDVVLGRFRPPMQALLGASGLVLLIAWMNVANLFAARRLETRRDEAVQRALGADGARLAWGRGSEGAIVATMGAAGAAMIAWSTGHILHASIGGSLPRAPEFIVAWHWFAIVAGATALVTVGTSVWSGSDHAHGTTALRTASQASHTRSASRGVLIVLETAFALVLVVGAMLLGASFIRLVDVEPGFNTSGLIAIKVRQPIFKPGEVVRHYPLERFARTAGAAVARVRDVPGVGNAAVLSFAPFTGERMGARVALLDGPVPGSTQATDAHPVPEDQEIAAGDMQMVSPEFFATIGLPMIQGGGFTAHDTLTAPQFDDFDAPRGPGVVIVSQSLANRLWPLQSPIGKFVQASGTEYSSSEVVGVVPDVRYGGLAQDVTETLYAPYAQGPMAGATLLVRTDVPLGTVMPRVRAALATLGADLAVGEIQTMDDLMDREAASRRFSAGVMTFLAAVGLALAALGLGGTIAFLVRRRTAEIGIRMALGATPAGVIRLFVAELLQLVGLGIVIGLLGAAAGSRVLTTLLFGVGAAEPTVYIGACAVLLMAALGAAYVPARRAARVNPIVALRAE